MGSFSFAFANDKLEFEELLDGSIHVHTRTHARMHDDDDNDGTMVCVVLCGVRN